MFSIPQLWLPVVLSAVGVFIASTLIHMVIRWHSKDQLQLPNEDGVAEALRGTAPGEYRLPYAASMEEVKGEAFQAKVQRGPVAIIGVAKVSPGMGFKKALGLWFLYSLLASWLAGHIAHRALHEGETAHYLVFHTVGLTAWAAYGMALAQQSIWGPKPWWPTIKRMIDALIYAIVTAGIFVWLWPM